MDQFTVLKGIVIKHSPVNENDYVVTILTMERGKITAFARGARKPTAHLAGTVEPFCTGTFKLKEGRSSYNIIEADIANYFESFRKDLEGACYGSFFLELADYYTRENADASQDIDLLYRSLRALESDKIPNRLVRCVYEIRMLAINGEYPGVPEKKEGESYGTSTVHTMQYIVQTPLKEVYSFKVKDNVIQDLSEITESFRKRFLDREMKSLSMLSLFEPGLY